MIKNLTREDLLQILSKENSAIAAGRRPLEPRKVLVQVVNRLIEAEDRLQGIRDTVEKMKREIHSAPQIPVTGVKYAVKLNHCNCHPETCGCNPYKVVDTRDPKEKTVATYYLKKDAEEMADLLNR